MDNWWRWILRGIATFALIVAGLLLVVRPIYGTGGPAYFVETGDKITVPRQVVSFSCPSTLDQIQGRTRPDLTFWTSGGPGAVVIGPISERSLNRGGFGTPGLPQSPTRACSAAITDREHVAEALVIGLTILISLSFLPRRRPVMVVPVNPSVL